MLGILKCNRFCKEGVYLLTFFLVSLWFPHCIGIDDALAAKAKVTLSEKEKKRLVKQGVVAYMKGHRQEAKALLEKADSVLANNYAVPYYLGAIYLEEGKRDAAIAHWQRYVTLDANGENTLTIRKYLTLLRMDKARETAREAIANGLSNTNAIVPDNTIAITPFENIGYEVLGPLGKGLASLLISDLSHVPNLKVVDRTQIQVMINAAQGSSTGTIDGKTAARLGMLLKAKHVITGQLNNKNTEEIKITSTQFDAAQRTNEKNVAMEGKLQRLYRLEKDLACSIVQGLGKDCEKMPEGFAKVHTRSLSALVAYSWGLEYLDQTEYGQAREMFLKALEADPGFELAEKSMIATPTSSMRDASTSQMLAKVASVEVSPASSTNDQDGGGGFGNKKMIIGGLALVGGGVALAGGGGGSGSDGNEPSSLPPALKGVWFGNIDNGTARFKLDLVQTNTTVRGSMEISGWECGNNGSVEVTGNVTAGEFKLKVVYPTQVVTMSGPYPAQPEPNKLSGSWTREGAEAPCNSQGLFGGEKATTSNVKW